MKTEEEARKLWCPHVRHHIFPIAPGASGGNRDSICVASCCMMWRWDHNKLVKSDYRKGFCGLGGKPQ